MTTEDFEIGRSGLAEPAHGPFGKIEDPPLVEVGIAVLDRLLRVFDRGLRLLATTILDHPNRDGEDQAPKPSPSRVSLLQDASGENAGEYVLAEVFGIRRRISPTLDEPQDRLTVA